MSLNARPTAVYIIVQTLIRIVQLTFIVRYNQKPVHKKNYLISFIKII